MPFPVWCVTHMMTLTTIQLMTLGHLKSLIGSRYRAPALIGCQIGEENESAEFGPLHMWTWLECAVLFSYCNVASSANLDKGQEIAEFSLRGDGLF